MDIPIKFLNIIKALDNLRPIITGEAFISETYKVLDNIFFIK